MSPVPAAAAKNTKNAVEANQQCNQKTRYLPGFSGI
jgi:hypothetical protein